MRHCCECANWTRTGPLWGVCSKAKRGKFRNHTSWCREGYPCEHATVRYRNQRACKIRFEEKCNEEEKEKTIDQG